MMTQEQIFKACCAKERFRVYMMQPYIDGEYVCATNGHIGVRILKSKCDFPSNIPPVPEGERTPPMNDLPWAKAGNAVPLPTEKVTPKMSRCTACEGSGKMRICSHCAGTGECECNCCDAHGCNKCDGTGKVRRGRGNEEKCEDCDGTGQTLDLEAPAQIGDVWLSPLYLNNMIEFGVKEVFVTGPTHPMRFSVGDIEGLLMPVKKPEKAGTP